MYGQHMTVMCSQTAVVCPDQGRGAELSVTLIKVSHRLNWFCPHG